MTALKFIALLVKCKYNLQLMKDDLIIKRGSMEFYLSFNCSGVAMVTREDAGKRRKLVLHLDVNNAIFIGDSITKSVTPERALNEYLTDVAWGQVGQSGEWIGNHSTLYERPPKENMVSYFRYAQAKYNGQPRSEFKGHIRKFTEEVGKPFRPFYDNMMDALKFPGNIRGWNGNGLPSFADQKGIHRHCIVPSFYKLLDHLIEGKREFAIVFRTFGGDGQVVLQATKDYFDGRNTIVHSGYPQESHVSGDSVENSTHVVNFTAGKVMRSSNQITLKCPEDHLVLSNYYDIYKYFSKTQGVKLFVDDYGWWKSQQFHSLAAKPLFIDLGDKSVHHIMLDDNFHPWEPADSIINLLLAKEGSFTSVDPATFDDVCAFKADLYQSICNRNYLTDKIELCERNYTKMISEKNE